MCLVIIGDIGGYMYHVCIEVEQGSLVDNILHLQPISRGFKSTWRGVKN